MLRNKSRSRKQEVPLKELQRQKNSYLQGPKRCSSACVIDATDAPPSVAEAAATRAILDHMEKRLRGRHPVWPWVAREAPSRPAPSTGNADSSDVSSLNGALDQFAAESPAFATPPANGAGKVHSHRFVILPRGRNRAGCCPWETARDAAGTRNMHSV